MTPRVPTMISGVAATTSNPALYPRDVDGPNKPDTPKKTPKTDDTEPTDS